MGYDLYRPYRERYAEWSQRFPRGATISPYYDAPPQTREAVAEFNASLADDWESQKPQYDLTDLLYECRCLERRCRVSYGTDPMLDGFVIVHNGVTEVFERYLRATSSEQEYVDSIRRFIEIQHGGPPLAGCDVIAV